MKVLMFNHLPAPYLVEFLNLMGKEIELTVIFKDKTSFDRENSWLDYGFETFEAHFLPKSFFQRIKFMIHMMSLDFDLFWNADYSKFECILLTFWYKLKKKTVLMHADGGIPIPRAIDPLIRFIMNQANYFATSGIECDKYYDYYHVDKTKRFEYKFTSQTQTDVESAKQMIQQREQLRVKYGVGNKKVLFSIGQQIPRKGYDVLVSAFKDMPEDVILYIAGGNPETNVQQIMIENNIQNIEFIGFKTKAELAEYFTIADMFVLPTRYDIWGLVINEAMAYGLPIISTEKCAAAVQFKQLCDNGIIVPIEDVDALNHAMKDLIKDDAKRSMYAQNSLTTIQDYTIETMVSDYVDIFKAIEKGQQV